MNEITIPCSYRHRSVIFYLIPLPDSLTIILLPVPRISGQCGGGVYQVQFADFFFLGHHPPCCTCMQGNNKAIPI